MNSSTLCSPSRYSRVFCTTSRYLVFFHFAGEEQKECQQSIYSIILSTHQVCFGKKASVIIHVALHSYSIRSTTVAKREEQQTFTIGEKVFMYQYLLEYHFPFTILSWINIVLLSTSTNLNNTPYYYSEYSIIIIRIKPEKSCSIFYSATVTFDNSSVTIRFRKIRTPPLDFGPIRSPILIILCDLLSILDRRAQIKGRNNNQYTSNS